MPACSCCATWGCRQAWCSQVDAFLISFLYCLFTCRCWIRLLVAVCAASQQLQLGLQPCLAVALNLKVTCLWGSVAAHVHVYGGMFDSTCAGHWQYCSCTVATKSVGPCCGRVVVVVTSCKRLGVCLSLTQHCNCRLRRPGCCNSTCQTAAGGSTIFETTSTRASVRASLGAYVVVVSQQSVECGGASSFFPYLD